MIPGLIILVVSTYLWYLSYRNYKMANDNYLKAQKIIDNIVVISRSKVL